jgi:hypothetical protein
VQNASGGNNMVKNRAKGNTEVLKVKKMYEKYGFRCWKPGNKAIWVNGRIFSQSQDIFGCYDLLAIKDGSRMHAIQVTSISLRKDRPHVKGVTSLVAVRRRKIDELGIKDGHTLSVVIAKEPRKGYRIWTRVLGRDKEWIEVDEGDFIDCILIPNGVGHAGDRLLCED